MFFEVLTAEYKTKPFLWDGTKKRRWSLRNIWAFGQFIQSLPKAINNSNNNIKEKKVIIHVPNVDSSQENTIATEYDCGSE